MDKPRAPDYGPSFGPDRDEPLYQCQRAPCGLRDCVHATPHEHLDRCDREGGRCGKCLPLPQNRPQANETTQPRTESRGKDKSEAGGQQMPEDGELTLFLEFEDGQPTLACEQWVGAQIDHDRPHWPLWQRAEAEATVERVKKAIGGGK